MSRRSRRSKKNSKNSITISTPLILAAIGLVVAGFFMSKIFNREGSNSYAGIAPLPIEDYQENGLSFRNNEYQLQGEVTEKPESDPAIGQLVFVLVDDIEVSIKVPNNVGKVNLETKHDYSFKVEVGDRGFLVAKDYQPL